jgi:hypothetical protein
MPLPPASSPESPSSSEMGRLFQEGSEAYQACDYVTALAKEAGDAGAKPTPLTISAWFTSTWANMTKPWSITRRPWPLAEKSWISPAKAPSSAISVRFANHWASPSRPWRITIRPWTPSRLCGAGCRKMNPDLLHARQARHLRGLQGDAPYPPSAGPGQGLRPEGPGGPGAPGKAPGQTGIAIAI